MPFTYKALIENLVALSAGDTIFVCDAMQAAEMKESNNMWLHNTTQSISEGSKVKRSQISIDATMAPPSVARIERPSVHTCKIQR